MQSNQNTLLTALKNFLIKAKINHVFLLLVLIIIYSETMNAAPGDWPGTGANAGISWMNYTLANGSIISDPTDINPAEDDIFYCPQDVSSVQIACDATNAFFRIQLITDPGGGPGGF